MAGEESGIVDSDGLYHYQQCMAISLLVGLVAQEI